MLNKLLMSIRFFLFFFCLLISFTAFSQTTKTFTGDYFLFIDTAKKTPILILGDSTAYKGYNFKEFDVRFKLDSVPLKDLRVIQLNDKTYVIDRGCGPVFNFQNDSLIRIDKSFRQHNQYNSSIFVYDNKMHLFGGYGLFTVKGIVTYYDNTLNEWLELVIDFSEKPSARNSANSLLINDMLYVWGGHEKDKAVFSKPVEDNQVWALDLKLNKWSVQGKFEEVLDVDKYYNASFKAEGKLYKLTNDTLFEFDILNNKITSYKFPFPSIHNCVYDVNTKNVLLVEGSDYDKEKRIVVKLLTELTSEVVTVRPFFISAKSKWRYYFGGAALLIVLVFGGVTIRKRLKKGNNIYFDAKRDVFLYQGQDLQLEFDLHELFKFLTLNQNEFILLDKVNELFTKKGLQESYITINKRRDKTVKNLIFKISTLLNIDQNQVLLERKHARDNRVKEIKLGIVVEQYNLNIK